MTLTPRRLLAALVAAAVAFLVLPAMASATLVAVFDDGTYVDTAQNGQFEAESDNIQASIAAKGYTVRAFTGITATNFSTALAGAKVLVIPEREVADLTPDLSGDAVHIIRGFVASGGGLILGGDHSLGSGTDSAAFLDRVFGIAVNEASNLGSGTTKQAAAAGTAFAGGPGSLLENSGTNYLTGLDAGAAAIYASGGNVTVAAFTVGDGTIVYLGWDWYDSNPPDTTGAGVNGGQNGGWQGVLGRALTEVAGTGCNITGSPGVDTLNGTSRGDRICAMGGSDIVSAGRGNDVVLAGFGSDTVNGGGGGDRLIGGPGADTLNGNKGRDFLDGRDGVRGNDHLNGGPGADTCRRDRGDHVTSC
jgi:Ca2+-binding RTX toxin-like protein